MILWEIFNFIIIFFYSGFSSIQCQQKSFDVSAITEAQTIFLLCQFQ